MQKPDDIPEDVWEAAGESISGFFMQRGYADMKSAVTHSVARAILAERAKGMATLQMLYDLLHNDTPNGGAASFLPGDGYGAEEYVDQALDVLRAAGVKRYYPPHQ